jgi:hypothetical protein
MTTIRIAGDQTLDLALIEGPAVIVQRADGELVVVRSEREGHEVLDEEHSPVERRIESRALRAHLSRSRETRQSVKSVSTSPEVRGPLEQPTDA